MFICLRFNAFVYCSRNMCLHPKIFILDHYWFLGNLFFLSSYLKIDI